MQYNEAIKILEASAETATCELKHELNGAIKCLKEHSDKRPESSVPECKYLRYGRCIGQKMAPACTAGSGYCPVKH